MYIYFYLIHTFVCHESIRWTALCHVELMELKMTMMPKAHRIRQILKWHGNLLLMHACEAVIANEFQSILSVIKNGFDRERMNLLNRKSPNE